MSLIGQDTFNFSEWNVFFIVLFSSCLAIQLFMLYLNRAEQKEDDE